MASYQAIIDAVLASTSVRPSVEVGPTREVHHDTPRLGGYTSPSDAPRSKKCECGLHSGTANKEQEDFVKKELAKDSNRSKMEIVPPIPSFSRKPNPMDYTLKKTFVFNPVDQLGFPEIHLECPFCSGSDCLKKKEFSKLRHVHCLAEDCYFTSIVYTCKKCKKSFNASDESLALFPSVIYLSYPIRLFKKTALHSDLVGLVYDLLSSTSSMASIIADVIYKRKVSTYLHSLALYNLHCK